MKVSVVVCTYSMDRYGDFTEAVESVLTQTYESVEVVLVVDGNAEVYDCVVDRFGVRDDVIVYCNEENQGVSYSRTKGAELASGEVVAFIDDDAVAEPDWVSELVEFYKQTDSISVGGRMEGRWLVERPWYLPTEFDWLVGVTYPGFAEAGSEVRNTFESNLSFRREAFLELGGFDESLGPDADSYSHSEGAEIGNRLRSVYDRGVEYNPNAVVVHKVFEHRIRLPWLLNRAFEQGVSKRRMSRESGNADDTETAYLTYLLTDRVPRRFTGLITKPSLTAVGRLLMLFVFTAVVGFGYLYETVKQSYGSPEGPTQ